MRRALATLATLAAATTVPALVPAPATAATPTTREPVSVTVPGTIDCGTFKDNYVDFYTGMQTTFYDASGRPTRQVIQWTHLSNDVNSMTYKTIHEHGTFTEIIDFVLGTDTVTGRFEIATVPGSGVVVQDVGRVVFDASGNVVFSTPSGRRSIPQDDSKYCIALS